MSADGGALTVHPLVERGQLAAFRASRVRLRCREVAVAWDADGSSYGGPRGLAVWVDGALRARSAELAPLTVPWEHESTEGCDT